MYRQDNAGYPSYPELLPLLLTGSAVRVPPAARRVLVAVSLGGITRPGSMGVISALCDFRHAQSTPGDGANVRHAN